MKQKTTRVMHKFLSLLLTAAILLTTLGIPVQAETAEQQTRAQGNALQLGTPLYESG